MAERRLEQAQRHAGHATPAMTARYSRSHVGVKNKVVDRVTGLMTTIDHMHEKSMAWMGGRHFGTMSN